MIVSWYVSRGFRDESGLFCTHCRCSFQVDFRHFFSSADRFVSHLAPDLPVFCPFCGDKSGYPDSSIEVASSNFYKFRKDIEK